MHKMTFFPLGNADCCRMDLECGRTILIDYAATDDPDDADDLRCDLAAELRGDLEEHERNHYDVVAFTHLDQDHFKGATEFFHLDHARKYQGDDRIGIGVLWVPAAFITEPGPDDPEARILQAEARYRFSEKTGIRIFSQPGRLDEWCETNGVDLDDRLDLISDAGKTVPEFSLDQDGVEFFVHSPFAGRQDENPVEDRNEDSLVLHATFDTDGTRTKALLLADATHEALSEVVTITNAHQNSARLEWDVVKIPHHCSYLALGPDKGTDSTEPTPEVTALYEDHGQQGAILVSTSNPIPAEGSEGDKDDGPPHREAAEYYRAAASKLGGLFVVTMEHPSADATKLLVVEIDDRKATLKKSVQTAADRVSSARAPRAGRGT